MKTWCVTMRGEAWGNVEVQAETEEEALTIAEGMVNEVCPEDVEGWEPMQGVEVPEEVQ